MGKFSDLFLNLKRGTVFYLTVEYKYPSYVGYVSFIGILPGGYDALKEFYYGLVYDGQAYFPPDEITNFKYEGTNQWKDDSDMEEVLDQIREDIEFTEDDDQDPWADPPIYPAFQQEVWYIPRTPRPLKSDIIVVREPDQKKNKGLQKDQDPYYISYPEEAKKFLASRLIGGESIYELNLKGLERN